MLQTKSGAVGKVTARITALDGEKVEDLQLAKDPQRITEGQAKPQKR
jgi:hypothetical protein